MVNIIQTFTVNYVQLKDTTPHNMLDIRVSSINARNSAPTAYLGTKAIDG